MYPSLGFRGHADAAWSLAPGALRYSKKSHRDRALRLLDDFKRVADLRITRPTGVDEELKWVQLAQHYGLPTRLLDWTRNAATGLYFAVLRPDMDGALFVINPVELNSKVGRDCQRLFDGQRDHDRISKYLALDGGRESKSRRKTIAVEPSWNSERILMQQGSFTLHGAKRFGLDRSQAASLMCIPILAEAKRDLSHELSRIGVGEMFIFPEVEHVCNHLKRQHGLG